MFHGLRRSSCEIVNVDELDDSDDLPHPDTLFSQLWQDDTLGKSCETSGKKPILRCNEPSMPDLTMQDELREFPRKYAPEAELYARDSCQADGIDETSSLLGKNFINIRLPYYDGNPCNKESVQENTDRSVSSLRSNQGVDRPDKEDNRALERPKGNKRYFKHFDTSAAMKYMVSEQRTEFQLLSISTGNTRLAS